MLTPQILRHLFDDLVYPQAPEWSDPALDDLRKTSYIYLSPVERVLQVWVWCPRGTRTFRRTCTTAGSSELFGLGTAAYKVTRDSWLVEVHYEGLHYSQPLSGGESPTVAHALSRILAYVGEDQSDLGRLPIYRTRGYL